MKTKGIGPSGEKYSLYSYKERRAYAIRMWGIRGTWSWYKFQGNKKYKTIPSSFDIFIDHICRDIDRSHIRQEARAMLN